MTLASRTYTGPDWDTVMTVLTRDGFRCALCRAPIRGDRGYEWVIHHRRPRAMGGTHREDANSPANLLALDRLCHMRVESQRAEALKYGWLVPQSADPALVAVLIDQQSRWVLLTASGGYSDNPPGGDHG